MFFTSISEWEIFMKTKLVLGGFCVMLAVLCAGCASSIKYLGNDKFLGDATTVLYPDDTVKWAELVRISAVGEAMIQAASQASYQTTQAHEVWKPAGYDFQYDRAELTQGIQEGNYRIGKATQNSYWVSGYTTGGGDVVTRETARIEDDRGRTIATVKETGVTPPTEVHEGHWQKLYADRPDRYNEVEVKTIENRTVTARDDAKYQAVYAEVYEAKENEIKEYITTKFQGAFRDIADDEVFDLPHDGKVKGKKIKLTLEKQLLTLPPGTILINGIRTSQEIITAQIVDGVFRCLVSQ
jgi:hypothetical protein